MLLHIDEQIDAGWLEGGAAGQEARSHDTEAASPGEAFLRFAEGGASTMA